MRKMRQYELAEKTGHKQSLISQIEGGKCNGGNHLAYLNTIALALRVSIDYLMTGNEKNV